MFILVKNFVLAYNAFMRLEQKVVQLLRDRKKTFAIAESCTGGLLTHRLTNVPGSSACLQFSCITYSNKSKQTLLKVPSSIFSRYGAVSEQAAAAMAVGVRKILNADFSMAITGIAGPTGATKTKPVGLVFVSIAAKNEQLTAKFIFKGSRSSIKSQATTESLKLLLEFLS